MFIENQHLGKYFLPDVNSRALIIPMGIVLKIGWMWDTQLFRITWREQ